jgi:hypothetical protein
MAVAPVPAVVDVVVDVVESTVAAVEEPSSPPHDDISKATVTRSTRRLERDPAGDGVSPAGVAVVWWFRSLSAYWKKAL